MKEEINLIHEAHQNRDVAVLIWNILCNSIPNNKEFQSKLEEYLNLPPEQDRIINGKCTVEILINGKPIDQPLALLQSFLTIQEKSFDLAVAEELKKYLSLEKIVKFADAVRDLDWEFKELIEGLMGKKIEWPED